MKPRRPKICPPLRFACERESVKAQGVTTGLAIVCRAFRVDDGQEVGRIDLEPAPEAAEEGDFLQVSMVHTFPRRREDERCGVGTKLYERAMSEACSAGYRLASDTSRSRIAENFWRKQVDRGRAECLYTQKNRKRGGDVVSSYLSEQPASSQRRWRCRRYAMKECPSTIDLSGTAARRIDWRSEPIVRRRGGKFRAKS